jgi:hypothetical protein
MFASGGDLSSGITPAAKISLRKLLRRAEESISSPPDRTETRQAAAIRQFWGKLFERGPCAGTLNTQARDDPRSSDAPESRKSDPSPASRLNSLNAPVLASN